MNDLEFAELASARIASLYGVAKRSQHQFPAHALIQTRALASLCCDMLYPYDGDWKLGLEGKINVLVKSHLINPDIQELLHKLRRWGNSAAHPEESLRSEEQLQAMANQALVDVMALIEVVFRQKNRGATVPDYLIVDESPDEVGEVCYRALFENRPTDQYRAGMLLLKRSTSKFAEATQMDVDAMKDRALDLLRYASDAGYAPARYQYGLALSEGKDGKENIGRGVHLIAMASQDGDIDALAWCGRSALLGLHDEPVDHERARDYLERAAAEDHPLALVLLSTIYREGLGVAANAKTAFDLTLRAAEAGYPIGQYQAGQALYHGEGVAANEAAALTWLQRASDAGLHIAQRAVGVLIRKGSLPGGFSRAEEFLQRAMPKVNQAHLDLADLYMSREEPGRWIEALALVQKAFEIAVGDNDEATTSQALQMAPPLIDGLMAARARMSVKELENFALTRLLFDELGRPYPNREQRVRDFVTNAISLSQIKSNNVKEETSGLPASVKQRIANEKVGRNELCSCGSGKKYKACCGL
jgi:TPR repeat protein